MFSSSTEPIVADDWLRRIGRELTTADCTDAEKVHFAAHQLDGPAAAWWENYTATYQIDTVTWDQFQQAFRTAHVSAGAMAMKKREFRNLRQGGRTVGQYVDDFSKPARYAPDDVATDATKKEKFLEGLNDELSMQLMVANFNKYQELVDRALMIEGKLQQIDSRKRKYGQGKYNFGAQQRLRFTPNSEDPYSITMEVTITLEEVRTTIVAPRTEMVMGEVTDRTVPTQQRPPRKI